MPLSNTIKQVFPGSNTPLGFYSYYDNIISQEKANKIFIIKGGPGTGKSSFMKKIATYFAEDHVEIEYHHCSADPLSLDAIVIVPAKVAIIDGTFPHSIDPMTPGAIDEIINFAPFWNETGIRSTKDLIIQTNTKRKSCFAQSYYYLKAGKEVYKAYAHAQNKALDHPKFHDMEQSILKTIFTESTPSSFEANNSTGESRHLFGSAITPHGFVDYLDTVLGNVKTLYTIKDAPGASASHLMDLIATKAKNLKLYTECFHSPINPECIDDIIIPSLNIAITLVNHYHNANMASSHVFDLKECFNPCKLAEIEPELSYDMNLIDKLFNKGIVTLMQAKEHHNTLESYYIPHVRFDEIDLLAERVIAQIEAFL